MIICDLQQLLYANLMVSYHNDKIEITEGLMRHMALNSIRLINNKFRNEYGELVIACDSHEYYWRRNYFPYYKYKRKEIRERQDIEWGMIRETYKKIVSELSENFSYRIINVDGAEADDVIGTLVKEFKNDMTMPIIIISRDHDFFQLHDALNVKQWDWQKQTELRCNDPAQYLREHIVKGDSGDGIPNILSPNDSFVIGKRQSPITPKRLALYSGEALPDNTPQDIISNFHRNNILVNLDNIPTNVQTDIIESFKSQANKPKGKILNYFIKYKLKELTNHLSDF